jgi:UDP-glucose 4-epimerase
MKILVTGGTGYIGSHTIVDLDENGFDVVSIDNGTRSRTATIDAINKITKDKIENKNFDLCDKASLFSFFEQQNDIQGIIHFAAYKSVPESVENPLLYYRNNLESLMNLLDACKQFSIPYFVFSSSCSVYGNVEQLPVTESAPMQKAESPYAHTKQIGEAIITDFAKICTTQFVLLRYFNPVGAHTYNSIGENPLGIVYNVVPRITGTAIGKFEKLMVFGHDYPTRDGTCIRDYVHVMDIANAHTKAIQFLKEKKNKEQVEIFNLGSGNGVTVLEAIHAFERVSGVQLNYELTDRRPGDVVSIYANNNKACTELNWNIRYSIDDMLRTAWEWEKRQANTPSV